MWQLEGQVYALGFAAWGGDHPLMPEAALQERPRLLEQSSPAVLVPGPADARPEPHMR